jgi:hypothetical protein
MQASEAAHRHPLQPPGSSEGASLLNSCGSNQSRARVTSFTSLRTTCRIPPMWREGAVDQGHSRPSKEREASHPSGDCHPNGLAISAPLSLGARRGGRLRPQIGASRSLQPVPFDPVSDSQKSLYSYPSAEHSLHVAERRLTQ